MGDLHEDSMFQANRHSEQQQPGNTSGVPMQLMRLRQRLEDQRVSDESLEERLNQGVELLRAFPGLTGKEAVVAGISMEVSISPAENVERFFEQLRQSLDKNQWVERQLAILADIEEAQEQGESIQKQSLPGVRYKPDVLPKSSFRSILSSDNQYILVGKGGARNDELTLSVARREDTFLHVKGYTGAHVILPYEASEISKQTFLEACQLAMHYSKAREQSQVEMTVALCKDITKEPDAPAGRVQVHRSQTYTVCRDPQVLARAMKQSRSTPFTP